MRRSGAVICGFGTLVLALGASGAARATDIVLEAEAARMGVGGKITSPMLIKDDNLASHGSYIEVVAGNDSKTTMPATEGVVSLVFDQPDASATFTIWARVIASFDGDDSFWLKMDNGSPIKWNGIPLGSAWHWVQVKADGASTAQTFTLGTGVHTLKIAYREDGTKLDELIITSNASFNPNTMTVPTAVPTIDDHAEDSSSAGAMISWQDVPGATSYVLTDDNGHVVASSTGHTLVSASDTGCFHVAGVGPGGTGPASGSLCLQQVSSFVQRKFPDGDLSLVAPMILTGGGMGTQSGTAESLTTVPAHGRGRYDFQIVGPVTITVWAEVSTPNVDNDSFWVRMDQGAWVKWNNIPNGGCSVVKNSDNGSQVVQYNLTTGSHFVEFAYREIGEVMFRLSPVEGNPTVGSCDD